MGDNDDTEVVDLVIVPANQATATDLDTIYGTRGAVSKCRCQWFKLEKNESLGDIGKAGLRDRQLAQAGCGDLGRATTSGLVGFLDNQPVAWCAVEPRPNYVGMLRATYRVPWDGRDEDKSDRTVWAITCLYTRAGYRDRGISTLDGNRGGRVRPSEQRRRGRGVPDHPRSPQLRTPCRHSSNLRRRRAVRGSPTVQTPNGHEARLLARRGGS